MKTFNFIIIISVIIFIASCGSKEKSTSISFDGKTFELPTNVYKAKNDLNLVYQIYSGFFQGDVNNYSISTQLDGYPFFEGSDNDSEKSYYDQRFVGITFYKSDTTFNYYFSDLEKQYEKKFIAKRALDKKVYYSFKTDSNLTVVIKKINRPYLKKIFTSISFYKGVPEDELNLYISSVVN